MKKLLSLIISMLFIFSSVSCDLSTQTNNSAESLKFTLTAGEAGEYGRLITYNKGTEFEETRYAFYVPEGTYTVTNKGKYITQVNVYSDETHITEYGWEEVAEVFVVEVLGVGKSITITVGSGQHVEIAEPSVLEFVQQ